MPSATSNPAVNYTPAQFSWEPPSIPSLVSAFARQKLWTTWVKESDTIILPLNKEDFVPTRYIHPITGRRLRVPSSPSLISANTPTPADDTLTSNHLQ